MKAHLQRFWDGQRLKFVWNKLEVLTLDGRSRPVAFSWDGRQYRRGLDGTCKEILRIAGPERAMHDATLVSQGQSEELMRAWAVRIAPAFRIEVQDWLQWLQQDARQFRSIYQSISILPPDQYRSLVFQLTEGCAYNRCNFCQLYRDRPYRRKGSAEFADHIGKVLDYFGPALPWRRGIFLGDANAAGLPMAQLAEALELIHKTFPYDGNDRSGAGRHALEFEQVSSFQDVFTGRLRSVEDWRVLRRLGLRQLHLGIESGSKVVLQLLGKPVDSARVSEIVGRLQQADIRVSLIFLLGAGGKELAQDHQRDTLKLLKGLSLCSQDRVYFSELLVYPGSDYSALSRDWGITPLTRWECREQSRLLREQLGFDPPPRGPALALYDVRQFVYV